VVKKCPFDGKKCFDRSCEVTGDSGEGEIIVFWRCLRLKPEKLIDKKGKTI
jgi:hypothetical protein